MDSARQQGLWEDLWKLAGSCTRTYRPHTSLNKQHLPAAADYHTVCMFECFSPYEALSVFSL